ncbi:MAG: WbqC family protein [Bacteroidales bacterium]|nr:WbqC family protein [Bacteroidales bacterium]
MARHNAVMIEVKETFPKQTCRNRTVIATAEGARTLTVPTLRHNHSRTDEVAIDYSTRWNVQHLRTIQAAYAASPYYLYYADGLADILNTNHKLLIDLNQALLSWLLKHLGINTSTSQTVEFAPPKDTPADYRTAFSPKKQQQIFTPKPYYQVFADRMPFLWDLSAIDLLMNLGPEANTYITNLETT